MVLSDLEKRVLEYYSREGMDLPIGDRSSKALRVSTQTIRYKLKKLEQNNVIQGYSYRLDYRMLGLSQVAWIFVSRKDKSVDSEELMNNLLEYPEIQLCLVVTGQHDLALKAFARDVKEMTSFSLRLQKELRSKIKSIDVRFIGRLLKWHQKIMGENFSNFDFDANDLKILSFKLKKPELNLAVCAKEIGLHRNTVSARWKKIVKEKLIMKKSVIINPEYFHDLGIGLNALMLVESEVGETENLASKLVAFDEVHELGIVNSRFDIVTSIRVKDVPSLYSFQNRLFASESINRLISATETIVVLSSKRKKLEKRGDLLALTKSK